MRRWIVPALLLFLAIGPVVGSDYNVPTGATRLAAGDTMLLLADDDAYLRARDPLTQPAHTEDTTT